MVEQEVIAPVVAPVKEKPLTAAQKVVQEANKQTPKKDDAKPIVEDKNSPEWQESQKKNSKLPEQLQEKNALEKEEKAADVKVKSKKEKVLYDEDELSKELTKKLVSKEPKQEKVKEETPEPVKTESKFNTERYKKELGIEAKDEDDVIKQFKELKESRAPKFDGKKIEEKIQFIGNLKLAVSSKDEDLYKNDLVIRHGYTEQEAEEQLKDITETQGERAIAIEARKVRNELRGYLSEEEAQLKSALHTPVSEEKDPIGDILNMLDEKGDIAGVSLSEFAEDIKSLKNTKYKSIYDVIPDRRELADAIIIARNREKIFAEVGKQNFSRGFEKCYNDNVAAKVLNQSIPDNGIARRQFVDKPNDVRKPDNDAVIAKYGLGRS